MLFSKARVIVVHIVFAAAACGHALPARADAITAHEENLAGVPPDRPVGDKATITLVSVQQGLELHEAALSMFIVDYAPGGSAVLHRTPSSGYVLVHVLSGAISAWAWQAGVGIYRAGETWVEPAYAYDIASRNVSARESAQALVILVTDGGR